MFEFNRNNSNIETNIDNLKIKKFILSISVINFLFYVFFLTNFIFIGLYSFMGDYSEFAINVNKIGIVVNDIIFFIIFFLFLLINISGNGIKNNIFKKKDIIAIYIIYFVFFILTISIVFSIKNIYIDHAFNVFGSLLTYFYLFILPMFYIFTIFIRYRYINKVLMDVTNVDSLKIYYLRRSLYCVTINCILFSYFYIGGGYLYFDFNSSLFFYLFELSLLSFLYNFVIYIIYLMKTKIIKNKILLIISIIFPLLIISSGIIFREIYFSYEIVNNIFKISYSYPLYLVIIMFLIYLFYFIFVYSFILYKLKDFSLSNIFKNNIKV